MKLYFLYSFKKDYRKLPKDIQDRLDKQLSFMVADVKHPSIRIKKMKGRDDIWEGRVTQNYRFTLNLSGDQCILRRVGTHSILNNP